MRIPYIWHAPHWFYNDKSHWAFSGGDHDERIEIDVEEEAEEAAEE